MPDAFWIKWKDGDAKDSVDVLSTQLFAAELSGKEILHPITHPRRSTFLAKCALEIANNVATLAYPKDEKNRWFHGTLKIIFRDHTRQTIKEVLWADEDTNRFENLSPDFHREPGVDQEARDEVERQKHLGNIARRPEQIAFSAKLRELYQERCAVTGCATAKVLEAAHIRVKKGKDINDLKNGILLRADIHALFDAGLISLTEDGTQIQVSKEFDDPSYQFLSNAVVHRPDHDAPSRDNILHHRLRFCFDPPT